MQDRSRQRFTLLDAMVLLAALALGLALMRGYTREWGRIRYSPQILPGGWGARPWDTRDWIAWAAQTSLNRFTFLMPLLATLTATVLLLRLRPPRPRLSLLLRQPGIVAAAAATTAVVLWLPPPREK